MGKTRNLFKKIRDTKGTFHAEMGTIKDRNGMDLLQYSRLENSHGQGSLVGDSTWGHKELETTK